MPAYRRRSASGHVRWHYRKVVILPTGSKQRIAGIPSINTKAAAQQAERDHVERLINPPPSPTPPCRTLRDFAKEFIASYVAANNKPSSVKGKTLILDAYLLPALGDHRLDAIGSRDIERLKAELLDGYTNRKDEQGARRKRSRKTVNNILAVLSKILHYAVEIDELDQCPRVRLLKLERQNYRYLDNDELAALLKVASREPQWLVAILLGADAGLRLGEIRTLQWDDWDRRAGKIRVQRALWQNTLGTTKGWTLRTLPLTARLSAALRTTRHLQGPYVLCGAVGSPLSQEVMRWNLPRLCRRAGIRPCGWHALRHTFCSHLAMRGAPAKAIQELAGHTSLTTTLRYMHLADGEKDRAIALLESAPRGIVGDVSTMNANP